MITKDDLYPHQNLIVNKCNLYNKGYVIAGTGTGKTLCQAELIRQRVEESGYQVITLKCPRIALALQLAEEVASYLQANGFSKEDYECVMMHSGRADHEAAKRKAKKENGELDFETYEQVKARFVNAQSKVSLVESNEKFRAELNDKPLIIITTYNSAPKVYDMIGRWGHQDKYTLSLNDECHFMTRSDFNDDFEHEFNAANKEYFFTATAAFSDNENGVGMNNEGNFGEEIHVLSIAEAIKENMILKVQPKAITCETVDDLDADDIIFKFVMQAMVALKDHNKKMAPKLLVATKGKEQLLTLIDWLNDGGREELEHEVGRTVRVLTVHSDDAATTVDGVRVTRQECDTERNIIGANPDEAMIIAHYDILSEGIDIEGLNGALIMRNMKESKFLQTVGRIVRTVKVNGKADLKTKPNGLLMIPTISKDNLDAKSNFVEILKRVKKWGYCPYDEILELIAVGRQEELEEFEGTVTSTISNTLAAEAELFIEDIADYDWAGGFATSAAI